MIASTGEFTHYIVYLVLMVFVKNISAPKSLDEH